MIKSLCIGCEFEGADKNNPTCRECDRRVEYVALIEGGGDIMEEIKGEERGERKEDRERTNVEHRTSNIEHRMKEQTPVIPAKAEHAVKHSAIQKKGEKICIVEGCGKKIAARDFCSTHFSAWQDGRIKHPILGKYFKVRDQKKAKKIKRLDSKKTAPVKKTKSPKSIPGKLEYTRLDGGLIIELGNYPRIKHQIDFLADKYLINSEHVIIGLLGEALAARKERRDSA